MDVKTLIESHEGRRKRPYQCTANKWTIGVGRNLEAVDLPDSIIEQWLDEDVAAARANCEKYDWFRLLSEVRQAACIDLMFNLGPGGFAQFKRFHQAMEARSWPWAVAELKDSRWYKQVGQRGPRICSMISNDRWPE